MGLIYMNNAMFDAAVGEFLKAVRHRDCRMARVNSYAAYYNVGVTLPVVPWEKSVRQSIIIRSAVVMSRQKNV